MHRHPRHHGHVAAHHTTKGTPVSGNPNMSANQMNADELARLRQLLDQQLVHLQTVVGRGYRFVAECEDHAAEVTFSAEDLGRAVLAAAGLRPDKSKG